MQRLRRIFAFILAVAGVLFIAISVWWLNFTTTALDPLTYKTALTSQTLYNELLPALFAGATNSPDPKLAELTRALTDNLAPPQLAVISDLLLPREWLRAETEANIDLIFAWLNWEVPFPAVSFDLEGLREAIGNTEDRAEAATIMVSALRPCTTDELALIEAAPTNSETISFEALAGFPLCKPNDGPLLEKSRQVFSLALNTIAQNLPQSWDFQGPPGASIEGNAEVARQGLRNLEDIRTVLWVAARLSWLAALIPLAILATIVMLTIRSKRELFRWLGSLLLTGGIISLIPIAVLPFQLAEIYRDGATFFQVGSGQRADHKPFGGLAQRLQ
jgi:hypothetical protein